MMKVIRHPVLVLLLTAALLGWGEAARSQGPGSSGSEIDHTGGSNSLLGPAPGSGGGSFSNLPGTGGLLGGRAGASTPKGVPTSASMPASGAEPTANQMAITAPRPEPVSPSTAPLYGTLEIPAVPEDDGPPDGLTLDRAIDITLQRSLDLRAKYAEIPMARADILQASLRANPVLYADTQLVPYQRFSNARPGGQTQYDVNITHPIDISHKRRARTLVAARAEKVLEAQYQEAVRQRIDDVYDAYVLGALSARQLLRYSRQSVRGLEDLASRTEELYRGKSVTLGGLNRVRIQLHTARLGLVDAEAAFRKAKTDLGSLMNLTRDEIEAIELRGSIQDTAPPPPRIEELRRIALESRPDVISYRLGVKRAEADLRLARANRYSDIFVLFQPYTFQDNSPFGSKSATSWALGVTAPLPVYNRNQGGIMRAVLNIDQTRVQLSDMERQALIDVEKAALDYSVTRQEVDELRNQVIPAATQVRDEARALYLRQEKSAIDLINAQLEFNQIAKQYLDTAIRHRRSMLALNTAVGRRLLP